MNVRFLAAALCLLPATVSADAARGRDLFFREWIAVGGSDAPRPFNERSCNACHLDAGPARVTFTGQYAVSRGIVVRLADSAGAPDPHYGIQLQNRAPAGQAGEGHLAIEPGEGPLRWRAVFDGPEPAASTRVGLRQATTLAGRGAIDAIPDAAIIAGEDPDDRDGDGISGRARRLGTDDARRIGRIGRFGWKAATASLAEQSDSAMREDVGRHDSGPGEIEDLAAFAGSLPIGREDLDPDGLALFQATGCAACHVPSPEGGDARRGIFSDLLLHDMGPALDDGVGEPGVEPAEWRTAPLIALKPSPGRRYLHDARAPDLDAAIRAHGGEASRAADNYAALDAAGRAALIGFLESL
ncbi:MAG: di-heme oxidoredictase family protein [Flavobacteriaceae bacterium]